jgi:PPOX class probable F420-dependent enzyme
MARLTEKQIELLTGPNFGVVATLKPDGSPQTTVVWVDWDGENVVFNTTTRRAKGRHLTEDPRVSITVWDRDDPYRFVEVEGVAKLDEEGADEHIRKLAQEYWGRDYAEPKDRVIVRIRPRRVYSYGID